MPVTFSVASKERAHYSHHALPAHRITQSSMVNASESNSILRNGLVHTVLAAYNKHHALIIGPDDIWKCIFDQLDSYLKTKGHTVDPESHGWHLPSFSTTTSTNSVPLTRPGSKSCTGLTHYGISDVALLGTQQDWIDIFQRIETLEQYGPETSAWRDLLRPVLARFIMTFEPGYADSVENWTFWQYIVDWRLGGDHPGWLTGWITAFCAFDKDGRWVETEKVDLHYRYILFQKGAAPEPTMDPSSATVKLVASEPPSKWLVSFFTGGVSSQSSHSLPQGLRYTLGRLRITPASVDGTIPPILIIDGVRYLDISPSKVLG